MYPYNIDKPIQKATAQGTFPEPIPNDERLLELMLMAMQDEVNDAEKYREMSNTTTDEEDKDIFRTMYLDNARHKVLLGEMYSHLSGVDAPELTPEPNEETLSHYEQLRKNVTSEIESAKFYRDLSTLVDDSDSKHMLSGILSDKQNNSILNMYLLTK
jgi:Rubrerythrin.